MSAGIYLVEVSHVDAAAMLQTYSGFPYRTFMPPKRLRTSVRRAAFAFAELFRFLACANTVSYNQAPKQRGQNTMHGTKQAPQRDADVECRMVQKVLRRIDGKVVRKSLT